MPQDPTATDDGDSTEAEEELPKDGDGDSATAKRKDVVAKLSHMTDKGKDGTRAKVRHAWDKLGQAKEDVSCQAGRSCLGAY